MLKISTQLASLFTMASALTLFATPCRAELGGAASKEAVLVQEQSPVVAVEQRLNVFEIKMSSGTRIREYANANNVVVAVTWQGPTLPNLRELLGQSFDTFINRPANHTGDRRSAELTTDDLVVQSRGRMHNFAGRAYLPKMLPAGFNVDQIK